MIANMLSFTISKRFQKKPVYHALLEQNHIYLPGPESRSARVWRAKNIMTRQADFIAERALIQEAWEALAQTKSNTLLVGDWNHLVGIVTRKTLEEAIEIGRASDPVGALAMHDFEYLHPDQSLELALERFGTDADVLPVLSRNGNRKVEGVITIDSILQFIHKTPG
jgi:CBS domain-containing protein